MEINNIKYCHVSAFISYGNSTPVYKQTFKFKVSPSTHHSLLLDKNLSINFLKLLKIALILKFILNHNFFR